VLRCGLFLGSMCSLLASKSWSRRERREVSPRWLLLGEKYIEERKGPWGDCAEDKGRDWDRLGARRKTSNGGRSGRWRGARTGGVGD
jgi:hypothetical protein